MWNRQVTYQKDSSAHESWSRRRKLKQEHKQFIEGLINGESAITSSVRDIKTQLLLKFPDFGSIHNCTIARWLKQELWWSYKQMEKKSIKTVTSESIRKFFESAYLQNIIASKGVEMIYIDEFSINTRHHKFRGWSKRGEKGYVRLSNSDFSASFIWALSSKQVYGVIGSHNSITSEVFKLYVKELWEHRSGCGALKSTPFILMYENWKVHTSKVMREFIAKSKLRSISTPSYSPICNAAEKLINSIKQQVKILHCRNG